MKKSCIYKEQLNIKIENYGYQNLFYSYNEDTTFEDLLEYISSLIPGLNICPCFYFTLSSFIIQDKINNTEKIKSKSFNEKKILILKKNEKNCNCNKNIINNLKISKMELIQKIKNLENSEKNLKGKIDELELDNSILNKILKEAENNEPQIIKQLKVLYQKKRTEKLKDNDLKINDKGEIIGNEKMIEVDSTKFYDIIIDINSIKGINKGWIIKKSERIIEEYEKFKEDKIVRVGVIGNSNKGKSFILSKISKIDLPSGTSIRTEGLSIKYPDLETYTNRRIALLDSAGLETPVLKDDKSEEFEKVIDKKIELEETSDIEKIQSGEEKII